MKQVSQKFSTTQIASTVGILITLYNVYAKISGQTSINLSVEEITAIAVAATPVVSFGYVMWRRTQKGESLKLGFIKR